MSPTAVSPRISNHHCLKIAFLVLTVLLLSGCGWPFGSRKLAFSEVAHLTDFDPDRIYWLKTNVLVPDSVGSWSVKMDDRNHVLWALEPRPHEHPTFDEYAANEKYWKTTETAGRTYGALRRGERVKFMYMQANVGSSMGPSMDCVFLVLDGPLAGRLVNFRSLSFDGTKGTFPFVLPNGDGPYHVKVPEIDPTVLSVTPIAPEGK